jgi:ABC-type amino acid transport substrate-binding protein
MVPDYRFERRENMPRTRWGTYHNKAFWLALSIGLVSVSILPSGTAASAATLDGIRASGKITFGYRTDARPFSYQDEASKPAGFSVDLCQRIAEEAKSELGLTALATDWVALKVDERIPAVQQGKVDLLCGADTETLTKRKEISFSIPIFPSGIGAILRKDAPRQLREILEGRPGTDPIWRASPARILEAQTFSVVKGTSSETWLAERLDKFQIAATVVPVENYATGIQSILDGNSNVFFADRPILFEAATDGRAGQELMVLDRLFTYEPLALALQRGDEDLRLLVDRALSRLFGSPEFGKTYEKWFGILDDSVSGYHFYRIVAIPE